MTKSTLFDRLNQELEAFGKKAQAALDEGKLQIELLRARKRRDSAARDLGMLVFRKERGGEVEVRRIDALLLRLDELDATVGRIERQINEAKTQRPAPSTQSAAGEPTVSTSPAQSVAADQPAADQPAADHPAATV